MLTSLKLNSPQQKIIVVIACLFAGVVFYILITRMLEPNIAVPPTSNGQYSKGEAKNSGVSNTNDANNDPSAISSKNNSYSANANSALVPPSGNFVSNHRPNLSGSPSPDTISSVCITTPGATCEIIFTKDNLSKRLPRQTTDSEGASYWNNLRVQDIGLDEGTWEVKAISSMNGLTKTTVDTLNLQVSP